MFRLTRSTIRYAATTLLVVFLSALLGPVAALAHEWHEAGDHLHLPGLPQAHHHHDDSREQKDDQRPPGGAPGHPPAKGPASHHTCTNADDQQQTVVSALEKLLTGPAAPAVLALPPVQSFLFRPCGAWDRQRAVVLVPPERLKPKIPDLRIFIGSLVI
jgi:hypothetical protein